MGLAVRYYWKSLNFRLIQRGRKAYGKSARLQSQIKCLRKHLESTVSMQGFFTIKKEQKLYSFISIQSTSS